MNDSAKKYVLVNGGEEIGYEADSLTELLRKVRFSADEDPEYLSDCFVGMVDVYGPEEWSRLAEDCHFGNSALDPLEDRRECHARSWLSLAEMPRELEPGQTAVRVLGDARKHILFDGEPTLGAVNWALGYCFDEEEYKILEKDVEGAEPETAEPAAARSANANPSGGRWRLEREGIPTGFAADTVVELLLAMQARTHEHPTPDCEDFFGYAQVVNDPEEWERILGALGRCGRGGSDRTGDEDEDIAHEREMWHWLDKHKAPRRLQPGQALVRFGMDKWALGNFALLDADDPAPANRALARWIREPVYRIVENR